MKWIIIFHLVYSHSTGLDTMIVNDEVTAKAIKHKIETDSIYINADPKKRGWIEISPLTCTSP